MKIIALKKDIARQILEKNSAREHKTFSKYACFSNSAYRFAKEKIPDVLNIRPPFFHDTDKIIHSLAYTRYIDKTQVFYMFENDHITHRVLHVQLVSKIARVIGRALSLNEDLIEAIALAHDLGHPPYGHTGEKILNDLTLKAAREYFCHNAQSVRALMSVENKGKGVNITLQVLDGILCHNGEWMLREYRPEYKKTPKEFLQAYENCRIIKDAGKKIIAMTLEGCVMRISDVIAYIGRDFEDAIILRLIRRHDIPRDVKDTLGETNASIINNVVLDLINNSYGSDCLRLSGDVYEALIRFSEFSRKHIYMNPKTNTQNDTINNMFCVLFEKYLEDLRSGRNKTTLSIHLKKMSSAYRKTTPDHSIVCDYIAGMTDDFFNKEFESFVMPVSFGYKL
jgi:dGTPase